MNDSAAESAIARRWTNRALLKLIWPLVIEQMLAVTMGIADTVMVATVGEHAVSGVSLVDAINQLLIIAFSSLATGGAVVVSQYMGRRKNKSARLASRQLIYVNTAVSVVITVFALCLRRASLALIYGDAESDVMRAAETYFLLSALSYPFLALYNSAASLYRATGNSRIPMLIALLVNAINIGGNAVFIFGFNWGVAGAGLATLICRITAAAVLTVMLIQSRNSAISLSGIFNIQIRAGMVRSILKVGIPSCLENSMFQIGKIMASRIFTSFGTAAIAANAIAAVINSFTFMPAQAFGMAMLTVVGQCVGAGDYSAAKRNAGKLMKSSYGSVFLLSVLTALLMNPVLNAFGLTEEAARIAVILLWIHIISTPVSWPASFILPNALRAAGDARYCMISAGISMWAVRVLFSYILAYPFGMGPPGVWIAMVLDWCFRAVCYVLRFRSGKWKEKRVI
ncbi:MAG: MATE family efflux transporter [Treponema sp.]|nr:MATE family efflux transporter [Treponema sp.]